MRSDPTRPVRSASRNALPLPRNCRGWQDAAALAGRGRSRSRACCAPEASPARSSQRSCCGPSAGHTQSPAGAAAWPSPPQRPPRVAIPCASPHLYQRSQRRSRREPSVRSRSQSRHAQADHASGARRTSKLTRPMTRRQRALRTGQLWCRSGWRQTRWRRATSRAPQLFTPRWPIVIPLIARWSKPRVFSRLALPQEARPERWTASSCQLCRRWRLTGVTRALPPRAAAVPAATQGRPICS